MPYLIQQRVRTRQPQQRVPLNVNNSIARDVSYVSAIGAGDALKATASGSIVPEIISSGISDKFSSLTSKTVIDPQAGKSTKGTIVVLHQSTTLPPNGASSKYCHILASTTSADTSLGWILMLGNGTGYPQFRLHVGPTQPAACDETSGALNDGLPHVTAGYYDTSAGGVLGLWVDGKEVATNTHPTAITIGNNIMFGGARDPFWGSLDGNIVSALFVDRILSSEELRTVTTLSEFWKIFEDEEDYIWVPEVAGGSSLAASGTVQVGGSGALSTAVALSGIGATLSSGSAAGQVAVSISAAGLAQAAASAGLSAQVLLAGAAAATAAGNATLATSLNALAAGAAQASGSGTINSGAPAGTLQASGQDVASGAAQIHVTVNLSGAGADIASGSAAIIGSPSNNIAASGGAIATASATGALVVALTAAGFVQAMGAGQLAISVAIGAYGAAVASGSATGAGSGITTDAPNGGIPPIILPRSRRAGQVGGVRPANLGGRRI